MEFKIKWIKRKQMTHENTYRDDTSLKANFNIFYRCHVVVLFTFHKYRNRRHVKNNACAVEIKIKWIKRKQMTHENTYRDDN